MIAPSDIADCERILADLPEWFGIADANSQYISGLSELRSAVAIEHESVVGFVSIRDHGFGSAEVEVMAVSRALHRSGIGRLLFEWVVEWCREREFEWLHVKTRGPSTPDPNYERTRRFWQSLGFSRLFESLTLWGPEDAALVLVMSLPRAA